MISSILIVCGKRVSSQNHRQMLVTKLFRHVVWGVKRGDGRLEIFVSAETQVLAPVQQRHIVQDKENGDHIWLHTNCYGDSRGLSVSLFATSPHPVKLDSG